MAWKWLLTSPGMTVRPAQVDHTVVGPGVEGGVGDAVAAHDRDPAVLDDNGRVGSRAVRVEHGRPGEDQPRHVPLPTSSPA